MCKAHFFTFRKVSAIGTVYGNRFSMAMLTEIYIGALLVDEELADQVWEAWDAGEINDAVAYTAGILTAAARGSSA
ncbi:MAG: hypothetical protein ABFS45_24410 [Pseudomonadota bacterium]